VISYLDIDITPRTLEDKDPCNFYHVAQLLTTIARKCSRVEITLRLPRSELNASLALTGMMFPRVCRAVISARRNDVTSYQNDGWSFLLDGRVFPDLCQLETDGFPKDPAGQPPTIEQQLTFAEDVASHKGSRDTQLNFSLGGLRNLQSLKIQGDTMLTQPLLLSLFGSAEVPTCLTTLEIVNCPKLLFAKNLDTWTTLFQRSLTTLPVLRKLKLHIVENAYSRPDIADEAEGDTPAHFCDFVRVFGQNIQHLGLALPFACRRMFLPPKPASTYTYCGQSGAPTIAREPLATLPQRPVDHGFKYRRIISWYEVCYRQHDWDAMSSCASAQGTEYSWEIVSDREDKASWHVGMHDAVHFEATDVTEQPY
jgi:hypothetical protein